MRRDGDCAGGFGFVGGGTWPLFLRFVLAMAVLRTSTAVKCLNCRTYDKDLKCDSECEGDFCVLWHYREMSMDHKIQGCIRGVDFNNLPMGCRGNKVEATLCLCNSTDLCNDESVQFSKIKVVPMIKLPDTKCRSFTEAPYIQKVNKANTCPSDYCFFTQTNVTNFAGESELTTSASCGQMPQYNFDFLIGSLWPGPGLFGNGCYLLQAQGKDTMLGCTCSADSCNLENPYPVTPGNVHCHLAYGATSEDQISAKEYCKGDFCVLQKTVVPGYGTQWLKGCLSANETDSVSKLEVGYRNIMGIEQWLCQIDFCNFDVQSVGDSSPHMSSFNFFPNQPPRGGKRILTDSAAETDFSVSKENSNFDGTILENRWKANTAISISLNSTKNTLWFLFVVIIGYAL